MSSRRNVHVSQRAKAANDDETETRYNILAGYVALLFGIVMGEVANRERCTDSGLMTVRLSELSETVRQFTIYQHEAGVMTNDVYQACEDAQTVLSRV